MRKFEEVKKEQDQAIFDLGYNMAKVEFHQGHIKRLKELVFKLANEADAIQQAMPKDPFTGE